jgi:hypothetical protein
MAMDFINKRTISIALLLVASLFGASTEAQVRGDHKVRCVSLSADDAVAFNDSESVCLCVDATQGQIFHDLNCNRAKDAGEYYLAGGTTLAQSIEDTDGPGTLWSIDALGDAIFNSVAVSASATPNVTLTDSTNTGQGSINVDDDSNIDSIMTFDVDIAGTPATYLTLDGAAENVAIAKATAITGALTATSYGGITEANLVDLSADEVITGDRAFDGKIDIGTSEAFGGADTTPDVSTGSFFSTDGTGQTLTDFDGAGLEAGDFIYVQSTDATVFACTGAPLDCGSADITTAAGDVTTWVYDGTDWDLIAYMDVSTDMGTDATGAGSGAFSDAGDPVVLNTTTKNVEIGDTGVTLDAKVQIAGDADEPQLVIEGHSTQTDDIFIVQQDDETQVFSVGVSAITLDGKIDIGTNQTFTASDATPDVSAGSNWTSHATAFTITDFDGAGLAEGDLLYVRSGGTTTYDCTAAGLDCGSADIVSVVGDITVWLYDGTDWDLISYTQQADDMGTDGTGSGSLGTNLSSTTDDILSDNGTILQGGTGATNNERLDWDYETIANTVGISSPSGVTSINFPDNSISTADLATEVRSMYWGAGAISADGAQCVAPAEVTINSGPILYTIICKDNDAGILYGSTTMPDGWDGGNPSFFFQAINTAADTGILEFDFSAMCRGDSDTVDNAWGTEPTPASITFATANDIEHSAANTLTPDGTCAAGDTLFWRASLDATATTTAVATAHIVGVKMEYTTDIGD